MVFLLHHQFCSHCLPAPSKGASHPHPSPSRTMSLPGSHRKLQCQLSTPHPPGPRLGTGLAWPRRVGTRPPNPLPGLSLRGTVDAFLLTLCLPFFHGCSVSTYLYTHPGFRSPPCRLPDHPTPTRQQRTPAHGDQVPTFHGHIAGRRFLGGQPQSHGGLDKARFHPDVRPLLLPPAAPQPRPAPRHPRGITAGPSARQSPATPLRPSPCCCSGAGPLAPSPRGDSGAKQGRGGSSPRC